MLVSATDILHFERWLAELGSRKGTDIHLTVGNVPMLRVAGKIVPLMGEEILTPERLERIVAHLLTKSELAAYNRDKQVITSRTIKKVMRFRINVFSSRGYAAVSLRHIAGTVPPLSTLGLPEMVAGFAGAESGLYLAAGPFDAGRTTTVASFAAEINRTQERYIIMLEEPLEYIIPSDKSIVVDRVVGKDIPTFAEGLSALANEDADVITISSFSEPEVIEGALKLANSGRLVVAEVEGRHVVSVLEMIRDSSPESERQRILNLLADSLLGITTQVLAPKVGGGRVAIVEALLSTHPVASLIRENKLEQIPNIMQTSRAEGMITLDKALSEAVKSGIVSLQDAKEYAVDVNQFNLMVSH